MTTVTKPTLFLDADFLGHLFEGKNSFNEQLGNAALDGLKMSYDLKITDQAFAEATRDINFATDKAIQNWLHANEIDPIHTQVRDAVIAGGDATNAGERSIIEVINRPENSGLVYKIATDDTKYFNPTGDGKVYLDKTLPIQKATGELLSKGHLNILDYDAIAKNNEGLNSTRSWIPKFLTDAQAFNVTPTAKELGHVADANGVVTDTKTGVKYNVSEVFKNLLTNQGGGTGTITDLANYLGTDATTLEHAIVNGAAKALAAIGVAAMIADIAYTSITARGQLDSGDVAGAQQSVATLAARTGLGVAGAQAGYSLGLSIPANDNYIINNYRLTA